MNRTIVFIALVLLTAGDGLARADEAVAVVVDRDNPKNDISLSELKEIFQAKRKEWQDGARIVVLDLEPGPVRDAFNKAVLGMDQSAVDQFWVEQKVRGAGSAPKVVNAGTAVKLVPRVRGAVSYVPLSAVDASVKVLTVAGAAPDKGGYPIVSR
jgi:ABC-type phosphate transport system substrate-binding protein